MSLQVTPTLSPSLSPVAQKLISLGVMAWCPTIDIPASRRANAERVFYGLILKARKLGFHESTKFIAGLRSGRATPKVVERAEKVCALIGEAEIDASLRWAAEVERLVGMRD